MSATPPPTVPPRRRRWFPKLLLVLLIVGGIAAVGAAGVGFFVYDRATRIDRSEPDRVVSDYLRAMLIERDQARADLYLCRDPDGLAEFVTWRDQMIVTREKELGVLILSSWGVLTVADRTDERATVTTDIRRSAHIDGVPQSVLNTWRFETVDQNGWRVCGATKLS